MSAAMGDRTHVRVVEGAIEAQVIVADLDRIDAAQDIRRERAEQLLGEAQRQLATIGRLDRLEDQARARLASTLRELAGLVDGVPVVIEAEAVPA